ncbi:hypothetical protein COLO4_33623 [Corchorus olitorius]|uniref:Uncharacterized protein n=1 Tax=Corchorus olitorius TaxID=93759 RepID=A0A1R3GSG4_9ROSI|nr:hypothetical protein COLO4_33624 [Corchorus olitorius]OMO61004.1 hypothetical protein COLO4_33623 [Corchorus olitorius]
MEGFGSKEMMIMVYGPRRCLVCAGLLTWA